MNILETMAQGARTLKQDIADKVKATLKREKRDEYHERLSALADECAALMQDTRYPKQQEFLSEAVNTLQDALQHVLVRDVKGLTREDTLLKACTIAAQIEAYRKVMTRPDKVLKELEENRKMVQKGDQ